MGFSEFIEHFLQIFESLGEFEDWRLDGLVDSLGGTWTKHESIKQLDEIFFQVGFNIFQRFVIAFEETIQVAYYFPRVEPT